MQILSHLDWDTDLIVINLAAPQYTRAGKIFDNQTSLIIHFLMPKSTQIFQKFKPPILA